ncbi:hypothetical protein WKH43_13015 [Pantoea agglomerans]|uniref:hypothetical protein n=1 Tax=Enterobacter agglomerans TaxID=549 RepID=UPI003C7A11C4
MTNELKQKKIVFNISERDYSKRLYKVSYQNYLTNEGLDIFEKSRDELLEKARQINKLESSKS